MAKNKEVKEWILKLRNSVAYDELSPSCLKWKKSAGNRKDGSVAGHMKPDGYWFIKVDGVGVPGHRAVWFLFNDSIPNGTSLDHKNGNQSDNRISNLRIATFGQNASNTKKRKSNKSGYTGVTFHKCTGKWRAAMNLKGKSKHIGLFSDKKDAARAYNLASLMHFGEFSKYNEVE